MRRTKADRQHEEVSIISTGEKNRRGRSERSLVKPLVQNEISRHTEADVLKVKLMTQEFLENIYERVLYILRDDDDSESSERITPLHQRVNEPINFTQGLSFVKAADLNISYECSLSSNSE